MLQADETCERTPAVHRLGLAREAVAFARLGVEVLIDVAARAREPRAHVAAVALPRRPRAGEQAESCRAARWCWSAAAAWGEVGVRGEG